MLVNELLKGDLQIDNQMLMKYEERTNHRTADAQMSEDELRTEIYKECNKHNLRHPSILANKICMIEDLVAWYDLCGNYETWIGYVELAIDTYLAAKSVRQVEIPH